MLVEAYIAQGSNLGDRDAHLDFAIAALDASFGIEVLRMSPRYDTDPVGPPPQRSYLNAVVEVQTRLGARELLARLLAIEREAGRRRSAVRDAPRPLDLDLLLYGDAVIAEPDLQVPHPRLAERSFVLEPLCDLAPTLVHPVLGERIEILALRRRDHRAVRRVARS